MLSFFRQGLFLLSFLALLSACGGGGGGSSSSSDSGSVTLGVSDAPVTDASSVTITVDRITFKPVDGDDIVVDRFTSTEMGLIDADTFQIDLLEVQGNDNRIVIDLVELPAGEYENLRMRVLDSSINDSYVDEISTSERKPLIVPSNELKLGGFTVTANTIQTFIIEFDLRKSMTYNPGNNGNGQDRYILKPRGVRIVELAMAASIGGTVDTTLFNPAPVCSSKIDPLAGNAVYLYEGHGLDSSLIGDIFDPDVLQAIPVPIGTIDAFSAATVGEDGNFLFSYVEPGDYTLAFSCEALMDDPEQYDAITIPSPATEIVEITLAPEQALMVNFTN